MTEIADAGWSDLEPYLCLHSSMKDFVAGLRMNVDLSSDSDSEQMRAPVNAVLRLSDIPSEKEAAADLTEMNGVGSPLSEFAGPSNAGTQFSATLCTEAAAFRAQPSEAVAEDIKPDIVPSVEISREETNMRTQTGDICIPVTTTSKSVCELEHSDYTK